MAAPVAVFFSDACVAESGSFSPSAGKPGLVVAAWQAAGLPIALHAVEPVTAADLCAVHDAAFVQGVLAGRVHSGFGNRRADVARSLPFTSGALLGETGGGRTDVVERSGRDAAGMVWRTGFV